jgi:hypothetical protein
VLNGNKVVVILPAYNAIPATPHPAAPRHPGLWSAGAVLVFAATLAGMAVHGQRGRTFAPAPSTVVVGGPEQVPAAWREAGVRGRALVLFDDYPFTLLATDPGRVAEPPPGDFVGWAIHHNVVRRIHLVLPDDRWRDFRSREAMFLPLRETLDGVYLFTFSGVPLVAGRPLTLPPMAEPVLAYVNADLFDPAEAADILRRRGISADLVVVLQRGARP